jgi:hypothetical protein
MKAPPGTDQCLVMVGDQPQDPAGLVLVATYDIADRWPGEIDDDNPAGPMDVNMRRQMVVRINDDPPAIDAQDRGHGALYQNLTA